MPCTPRVGQGAIDNIQHFTIYPNPVTYLAMLNIEMKSASDFLIIISDMQGRKQLEKAWTVIEGVNETALDISSLSSGVYMMELFNADSRFISKIVKE